MAALEQSSSSTETDEQLSSNAAPIPWFCCSDGNHWPLAERLVAQLGGEASPFAPSCRRVEDLGGLPAAPRAACPCRTSSSASSSASAARRGARSSSGATSACSRSGSALRAAAAAAVRDADLACQREFADAGLNVGFLVVRPSPRSRRFCAWREEMAATKRLDQKVLNQIVLRGGAPVRIARLDAAVWASSNAAPPPLGELLLHHANFTLDVERRPSSDPAPKLAQLLCVVYGCVLMLEIRTRSPSGTRGSRGFGLMRASTATARATSPRRSGTRGRG
ncbi:hypothetical protein JL722_10932 [Aureococcus anophagefferens]|nr:hypothetical protein JL722_10932 [Aureococcus anophagefferens]